MVTAAGIDFSIAPGAPLLPARSVGCVGIDSDCWDAMVIARCCLPWAGWVEPTGGYSAEQAI